MQLTTAKRCNDGSQLGWRWMWLGLGLLLAGWPACGLGQDDISAADTSDGVLFGEQYSGRSGQAFGSLVRGGFVTGPGIGRDDGFAPLELMPYLFVNDGMFLGDLRGFRTTEDQYGFNTGVGYRQYVRGWDRIFGINAFYDYDNSSTQLFRQAGIGLETYGTLWDMRLNTYFPLTDDTKQLSLEFLPESLRYSGNNILFDQVRTFGVHMKGLDHELGVPLPGRISERHRVRGYAGWYHFQGRDVPNVWGWKGRLQGDLTSHINLALEVTNDSIFDTNVIFSVAVSYGGYKQPEGQVKNQFDRMTTPIQRQYTAVIQKDPVLEAGLVALKPDGTPYFVEHVASEPPYNRSNLRFDPTAPLGSFENPFFTIQQAQANPGGDIIFTWTNSTFDNLPVTIESGVQTLGEADGVVHTFLLQPFGFVNLPRANDNPDPNVAELRPLLTFSDRSTVVDAVTLTSGIALPDGSVIRSEFSGFRIGDVNVARPDLTGATGNGIVGDNVTGVTADQNQINFAQGDGILLNGVGDVTFFNTQVLNAAGNGLHVVGGQPRVVFEGDSRDAVAELTYNTALFPNVPQVPGGHAVLIEDTQAGSLVDLFGTSPSAIDYTNAGGILVTNANGSARFGDVTLIDTFVQNLPQPVGSAFQGAINIFNSTAAYTFAGPILIDTPDVDAIVIEEMSGQTTVQGAVVITDRQARGLNFFSNSGNILFTDTESGVLINTTVTGAASIDPAVQYLASSGDVTFSGDLTIGTTGVTSGILDPNNVNGSGQAIVIGGTAVDPVTGLPIDNNTGTFEVNGGTSILGYQGTNLLIIDDESTVRFDDFSIDERGVAGQRNGNPAMRIEDMAGDVTFTGISTIGNTLGGVQGASLEIAASLIDNTGDISFSELTISNASAVAFANQVAGMQVLGTPILSDNGTPGDPTDDTVIIGSGYTGNVNVNTLNITATNGKGLFAQFAGDQFDNPLNPNDTSDAVGGLFTDGGTINVTGETGIQISNSRIGLLFNSVSVTQSLGSGIYLEDNIVGGRVLAFAVDPGVDIFGAGGEVLQSITVATNTPNGQGGVLSQDRFGHGAFFQNTGLISLRSMNFTQNQENGVFARNVLPADLVRDRMELEVGNNQRDAQETTALTLQTTQFTQNGRTSVNIFESALLTVDVPNVNIINSNFIQNAGTIVVVGGLDIVVPEIDLVATVATTALPSNLPAFQFNLDQIDVDQTLLDTSTAIRVRNAGGPRTPLSLSLTNSTDIEVDDPFPGVFDVRLDDLTVVWNGPANILIANNDFVNNQFSNGNGAGIAIQTLSTTDLVTTVIAQNNFQVDGDVTRGIILNASGPSVTIVDENTIDMTGTNAFGTQFTLAANSSTSLTDNTVVIQGEGAEGFVFNSIADPAFVFIDNNIINLFGPGGGVEIGIDFRSTQGVINFGGTNNNAVTINGFQASGFPWFNFPVGGQFNGSFLLNNILQP